MACFPLPVAVVRGRAELLPGMTGRRRSGLELASLSPIPSSAMLAAIDGTSSSDGAPLSFSPISVVAVEERRPYLAAGCWQLPCRDTEAIGKLASCHLEKPGATIRVLELEP